MSLVVYWDDDDAPRVGLDFREDDDIAGMIPLIFLVIRINFTIIWVRDKITILPFY